MMMICQLNVAGGDKVACPNIIAAVKRTSRYKMEGNTSQKIHQSRICTMVANIPAKIPAYNAAGKNFPARFSKRLFM